MAPICPIMSANYHDHECLQERCALWDDGVYDEYEPGCGLVPRENRRA